jgi:hypothetical protein
LPSSNARILVSASDFDVGANPSVAIPSPDWEQRLRKPQQSAKPANVDAATF